MDSSVPLIMNLKYTIARYEHLDKETFLIAFNIEDDNGNCSYIESKIPSSEVSGKNPKQICQLAYDNVRDQIQEIKRNFEQKNSLRIGYQFFPDENG